MSRTTQVRRLVAGDSGLPGWDENGWSSVTLRAPSGTQLPDGRTLVPESSISSARHLVPPSEEHPLHPQSAPTTAAHSFRAGKARAQPLGPPRAHVEIHPELFWVPEELWGDHLPDSPRVLGDFRVCWNSRGKLDLKFPRAAGTGLAGRWARCG